MAYFRKKKRLPAYLCKKAMLPILAASLLCFPVYAAASGFWEAEPVSASGGAVYSVESVLSAAQRRIRTGAREGMRAAAMDAAGMELSAYAAYADSAPVFERMAETWESAAAEAFGLTMPWLSAMLNRLTPAEYEALWPENVPSWQCAAALTKAYGGDAYAAVISSLAVGLTERAGIGQVSLRFGTFEEMAAYGTEEQLLTAKFAYAYLNTVYDGNGVSQLTEKRVYDAAYLAGLRNPLPGSLIKDCWFDPRDRGTRLHTGADIKANSRARIRSVTDGTVLYIGFLPVPGNYVVVRDPQGYEYHYYHMYEQSKQVQEGDVVRAGDVIGLVGNTGNSAANHLHVAVIAPDGCYVNPYDLFLQAGFHPIRKR